jgi:four helix bundle protein
MVKKENVVRDKSYSFAKEVIFVYQKLVKEKQEFVLSKQFLRSGTSIGANVEEAIGAQSRKDFFYKMTIAYKEARETKYWIKLLLDTGYLDQTTGKRLKDQIEELLRIIGSIQNSTKAHS